MSIYRSWGVLLHTACETNIDWRGEDYKFEMKKRVLQS